MNGENETGKYLTGGDLSGKDKKKRKLNTKGKLVLCGFGTFVVGAAVIAGSCFSMLDKKDQDNLKKEVILEAGSRIRIEDFFSDCPEDARFETDISDIDTKVPAVYLLTVSYEKTFTEDVTLKIEDHTGPKGRLFPRRSIPPGRCLKLRSAWIIFMICPGSQRSSIRIRLRSSLPEVHLMFR